MNLTLERFSDGEVEKTFEFEGWSVEIDDGDFGYTFFRGSDHVGNQFTLTLAELYSMCEEVEELQASRAERAFPATLTDEHASGACDCGDDPDFYEDDAPPADEPEKAPEPYPISPKDIRFVIGILENLL